MVGEERMEWEGKGAEERRGGKKGREWRDCEIRVGRVKRGGTRPGREWMGGE